MFRPWLIATGLGAMMGWSLLRIGAEAEQVDVPDSYAELAPRAATNEWLAPGGLRMERGVEDFVTPPSVAASSAEWFSPAAPIAAEAAPSDAVLYPDISE